MMRDEILRSGRWLDLGVVEDSKTDYQRGNLERLAFMAAVLTADDLGNLEANPGDLVRLWREFGADSRAAVDNVVRALVRADLLRLYEHEGKRYAHIPRFRQRLRHLKHAHPRPPANVECSEIKELLEKTPDDRQTNVRRTPARARAEVKGSEGKRSEEKPSDGLPADAGLPPARAIKKPTKRPPPPKQEATEPSEIGATANVVTVPSLPPSVQAWEAYRAAYAARYKVDPVRNAMVNAQLVQFVARVGAEDAPDVAAYFVRHNEPFYVRKAHNVGTMLADAEKLRMEWATGTDPSAVLHRSEPPALPWWKTDAGIIGEGKRLGLEARPGENISQFLDRIKAVR